MTKTTTKSSNSRQNQAERPDIVIEREGAVDSSEYLAAEDDLQTSLLEGVSRTFALTIPQLPVALRRVVSNAYLLCRTIDTIEDEPGLALDQKKEFSQLFVEILEGKRMPNELSNQLYPLLTNHSIPAEHQLIKQLDQVVSITYKFEEPQRQAVIRCVRIMSEGMVFFQHHAGTAGLKDQQEMDKYCYHVAGIVGEMLTELFCHYSKEIAIHKKTLLDLSKSFGQGLQMTNILKDIWDDQKRGACWLPSDLFESLGLALTDIQVIHPQKEYHQCIRTLVGIAHRHLEGALKYTLLIPSNEKGIREFCLWALGMALLTLRKVHHRPGFIDSKQVKISRNSVRATVMISSLIYGYNKILSLMFKWMGRGMPKAKFSLP